MLYSFVLCFLVCAYAAPPTDVVPLEKQQPTVIPIVSQSEELEPNGTFKFSYETGNGIKREEISFDKVVPRAQGRSASSNEGGESGESDEIHVQQGSYSYTAPDGTVISVRYIADENGFQPIGDHIPRVAPLAQSAASSSGEKTGRALKAKDSTGFASAPIVVAEPEIASRIGSKQESTKKSESKPAETSAAVKPSESKSEAPTTATTENESSTKSSEGELTKPLESSTTEAASTEAAKSTISASPLTTLASEISTTGAPSSSEASDSTTTVAATTTQASESTVSSLESSEPSSTAANSESTTTGAPSTA